MTLIETMHRYATTTPEARELVAELEFVWDQIKSNPASSTDSSPGRLAQMQGLPRAPSPGFGPRPARNYDESGLQVLPPLSDGDEEDEEVRELEQSHVEAFARGNLNDPAMTGHSPHNLDANDRKWRKRVEKALVKMTVEIAALREQMETNSLVARKPRSSIWAFPIRLVGASLQHLSIDLAILTLLVMYARWKKDSRVDKALRLLFHWARDQLTRLQVRRFTDILTSR